MHSEYCVHIKILNGVKQHSIMIMQNYMNKNTTTRRVSPMVKFIQYKQEHSEVLLNAYACDCIAKLLCKSICGFHVFNLMTSVFQYLIYLSGTISISMAKKAWRYISAWVKCRSFNATPSYSITNIIIIIFNLPSVGEKLITVNIMILNEYNYCILILLWWRTLSLST